MMNVGIQVDSRNAVSNHRAFEKKLLAEIGLAAEEGKEILIQEIRDDLASKILRPRESDGELSDAIDGEVIRRSGNLIIGVGDIEKMNAEVPYWRLQDEGGPIAVTAVPGFFVDESGQRVPFDKARAPTTTATPRGFRPSKFSNDVFIYTPNSPGLLVSIMWVKNDVKPKRYFEGGNFEAKPQVLRLFELALRRALR